MMRLTKKNFWPDFLHDLRWFSQLDQSKNSLKYYLKKWEKNTKKKEKKEERGLNWEKKNKQLKWKLYKECQFF
jgi:hypothetical protein